MSGNDHHHGHGHAHDIGFEEHDDDDHAKSVDARDHYIRAAYILVIADAAVSVLAIIG